MSTLAEVTPSEHAMPESTRHSGHSEGLVGDVRGEFLEMPGLTLTLAQAARLFGVDTRQSKRLLKELLDEGFLVCDGRGAFRRRDVPIERAGSAERRTRSPKSDVHSDHHAGPDGGAEIVAYQNGAAWGVAGASDLSGSRAHRRCGRRDEHGGDIRLRSGAAHGCAPHQRRKGPLMLAPESVHTSTGDTGLPAMGVHLDVAKMPAHWLMARLGKRVLRPGGLETTRCLLRHAGVGPDDDVIEFAPGLGRTATLILARGPRTYAGVERDERAAQYAERSLARAGFDHARVLRGDATSVPLPAGAANLVIGEAMLSMQTAANKRAVVREAWRLLRPGGRYVIHGLAVTPDALDLAVVQRIQRDLSSVIHVGVRIGTVREWTQWLEEAGFTLEEATTAPMRLLEPERLIRDEGLPGTIRFLFNALRTPGAVRRLRAVRGIFRTHRQHLCAVALIARKKAAIAAPHERRASSVDR